MLKVSDLSAAYRGVRVLHNIDLDVQEREIVTVIGSNGAGKTTLMNAVSGLMTSSRQRSAHGRVKLKGKDISRLPSSKRLKAGLALVPEGRHVWPELSVSDNLRLGAFTRRNERERAKQYSFVMELFPRLQERLQQEAGTLSGGEQQMLAIGRALMANSDIILLDEPSTGLSPAIIDEVLESIVKIRDKGKTVLLVEQMVNLALRIADRGYVLERGRIVSSGTSDQLRADPNVKAAYLGVSSASA